MITLHTKHKRDFMRELEQTAQWQSRLHHEHLLPPVFDAFTALVGNYPWQMLVIVSGITAGLWSLLGMVPR